MDSPSVFAKFKSASLWSLLSLGLSHVLRLVSNLILAKLLAPDLFGLMALSYTFLYGLTMLTETGTHSIGVQSHRGEEPDFLNALWILDAGRSIVVATAIWLLAAFFHFRNMVLPDQGNGAYADARLPLILIFIGFSAMILGFESSKRIYLKRNLDVSIYTRINMEAQLLTMIFMVAWALYSPTVLALAVPPLLGNAFKVWSSHFRLQGPENRLKFDFPLIRSLLGQSKWLVLSSTCTFFLNSLDKLVLAGLLSATALGQYSIAMVLASAVQSIFSAVSSQALMPAFSQLLRESPERLAHAVAKAKTWANAGCAVLTIVIYLGANAAVTLMYDDRYAHVGEMLRVLSFTLVATPAMVVDSALIARGMNEALARTNVVRLVLSSSCLGLGYWLGGSNGAIVGVSMAAACTAMVSSYLQLKFSQTTLSAEMKIYSIWVLALLICIGLGPEFGLK